MKRALLGTALALALALAAGPYAGAARAPSLFPLADGNRWTFTDLRSGTPRVISVRRQAGALVLRGFPGTAALRVRRAGQGVQAWDAAQRRWEPFLRLGAPRGTRYTVDLAGAGLWRKVVVTVESKRAVVQDSWDRTWRRCTRLGFRYRLPIADAGLEGLAFAPGVGPVWFEETTIAGPRVSALSGHRIRP